METINGKIARFIELTNLIKELTDEKEMIKKLILEKVGNNDFFETDDFIVNVKVTTQNRIDTKSLEKDFPDIKEVYSKPVIVKSINPIRKVISKTA